MKGYGGAVLIFCAFVVVVVVVFSIPSWCAPTSKAEITRCGDSVYYFGDANGFGAALDKFMGAHPEYRVVAVAPLDTGTYGATIGYWIVVEKRP